MVRNPEILWFELYWAITTRRRCSLFVLTLMARLPSLSHRKAGMLTGKFCNFPMKWCPSRLIVLVSSWSFDEVPPSLFMARMRQMWACRRSMTVSCLTKVLRSVRVYLDLGKRCSSSPWIKISFLSASGVIVSHMLTGSVEWESIVPCMRIVLA